MNVLRNEKGFSFLEMSIVIVIIGVLMFIGIPNYKAVAEKAQKMSCEANRELIEAQLENYHFEFHEYPVGTTADVLKELKDKKFLKKEPDCPSGGTYTIKTDGGASVTCTKHP